MAATTYLIKETLDHDGKRYSPGKKATLDLTPENEALLLFQGIIEPVAKGKGEASSQGSQGE